ncbi:hypothetical protein YT1_3810 [Rhodococcus ruber]|nr:hypothetical protein YT1_3810 [Rhodococcus ruber]
MRSCRLGRTTTATSGPPPGRPPHECTPFVGLRTHRGPPTPHVPVASATEETEL